MNSIDVSSDATVRIKLTNEWCVVTFVGEGSKCRVCAYSGHAICNGDWSFPALPNGYVPTIPLAERSAEPIKENTLYTSRSKKSGAAATISPPPNNEVDGDVDISKSIAISADEQSWRVSDDCNALFFRGKGRVLDFKVNSSEVDPEYEFFRRADGRVSLFSGRLNYKQFILENGWQVGVRDTAPSSVAVTGFPVNFWVARSPYAKRGEGEDVGNLRSTAAPIPLASDPTTLLYEMPRNFLNTDEGCMNHRNFKVYWMENEQRNICGIVVGTGNSAYSG
ncbi:MAG: hypothetical protein LBK24_02645 [Puniceicoccales bacterium]|jgi:hypothetical protein|nr:hypothetical protein [Puniceicoccales bacterium]